MSAGEKEIVLASEEVQRRNIKAMLNHGNETRKITRDLEKELEQMKEQIRLQDQKIEELRNQIVNIQARLYQGGTR